MQQTLTDHQKEKTADIFFQIPTNEILKKLSNNFHNMTE